jgi:hypothetical protein
MAVVLRVAVLGQRGDRQVETLHQVADRALQSPAARELVPPPRRMTSRQVVRAELVGGEPAHVDAGVLGATWPTSSRTASRPVVQGVDRVGVPRVGVLDPDGLEVALASHRVRVCADSGLAFRAASCSMISAWCRSS